MMIDKYKKIVVKIGSSSIINSKTKKINTDWLKKLCKDIEKYHKDKRIIIVCLCHSSWLIFDKKK